MKVARDCRGPQLHGFMERRKINSFTQSILMAGVKLSPSQYIGNPFILMWWLNCSGMRIWPCVTPEHSERKILYPGRQPATLVSVWIHILMDLRSLPTNCNFLSLTPVQRIEICLLLQVQKINHEATHKTLAERDTRS